MIARFAAAYTAFVAVAASGRTEGKHGTTVHQAVPVPRGGATTPR